MLNIAELESRWLKYKIKSYIPHGIIGISVVTIIFLLTFLMDNNSFQKSAEKSLQNKEITNLETVEKKVIKSIQKPNIVKTNVALTPKKVAVKKESKIKQIKLAPSLNFMKSMQSSSMPYDKDLAVPKKKSQQKKVIQKPITKKAPAPQPTAVNITKQRVSQITIKRRDTKNDIHTVIKRFNKNNNPGLSLFIAKKYYELADYEKAYNYALITNKINSDIEDSWLLFAKSLFKLGKKDAAMKILKKYIKNSYSSSAKLLLENMRSGKFQ